MKNSNFEEISTEISLFFIRKTNFLYKNVIEEVNNIIFLVCEIPEEVKIIT